MIVSKFSNNPKRITLIVIFMILLIGTAAAQPYPAIPDSGYPAELAKGTFFSNSDKVYVYDSVDGKPTLYNVTDGQYVTDETALKDVAEILKVSLNPQIQKNTTQGEVDYIQETQKNTNILKYLRPFRDTMLSIGTDLLFTKLTPWDINNKIDTVDSLINFGVEWFKTEAHSKAFILRDANENFDMLIAQGNRTIESYEKMLTYTHHVLPLSLYYEVYLNQKVKDILYPGIVSLVSDLYIYDDDVFNKIGENIVSKFSDIGIDKISTVVDWYSFIFESYILEIPEYQAYSKKVINNIRQIQENLAFYEQSVKLISAALTFGEMKIPEGISYDIGKEQIEKATDEKIAGIEIPMDDEIIVYTQFFYNGGAKRLKIGGYCTLEEIGLSENISSIKIGKNVKVVLYKEKYFGNDDDKTVYPNIEKTAAGVPTIQEGFNKKVQSLVVMNKNDSKDYKPECPDKPTPEKEGEKEAFTEPKIPSEISEDRDDVVIIYKDPSFNGESRTLSIGGYCNANEFGLPNDSISSIKVGKNVKAVVYKGDRFNDDRLVLPSDEDIRAGKHEYSRLPVDFDEQISSIVVMGINDSKDYKPDCGDDEKQLKEPKEEHQIPEVQKPVEEAEPVEIDKEKVERQKKELENSFNFPTQNGSFDKDHYEAVYPVDVPGNGKLTVTSESSHELRINLSLYDVSQNNRLAVVQDRTRTLTLEQDGLSKGTYYIIVRRSTGEGTYQINAEFTPAKFFDIYETNDDVATAYAIGKNSEVEALIGFGNRWYKDSVDWYKVTLPGYGKLTVTTQAQEELRSAYIYLYNTDGRSQMVSDQSGKKDSVVEKDGLAAGTYFIRIQGYGFGPYTMKTNFTPANIKRDSEPNDNVSQAQAISIGEEINGLIGYGNHWYKDSADWYKVTLPSEGTIIITTKAQDDLRSAYLHLYNINGYNSIVSDQKGEKISRVESQISQPGTYFIKISPYGFGEYSLNVQFSGSSSNK